MGNGDRTITTRLKLEIGDLKAKAREAAAAYKGIGDGAKKGTEPADKAVKDLGKSLRDNSAEWDQVSGTALKAGGLLAAGVGVVVKSYADFDKQMSSVSATGADARQNIDALRETAIRLGADTQFSAGEAAQGIEELLKAGVSASDVMGGGLAGALDLAAAGQIRVADAAEIAATAMVQFRLSGQEVPHIADLLAAAAGKAQGEVGDMAMALKQSGLVASQMGLSIEETTGTLAAFASAGLLGSDAGTAFRTMLLRLANPSKEADALMDSLGISAYDAQGNFVGMESLAGQLQSRLGDLKQAQRDSALATLFGSDAIRAANVLYENGSAGIAKWKNEVNDAGFASATAAEKTNNLYGDIERLGGAIDSALVKSGSGANEFLRSLAQRAEGAVEAFGGLPEPVLQSGAAIGGLGAASLLAFGGVSRLAVATAENAAAMKQLAADSPRAANGIKGLSIAAGVAVGVTALFQAIALLQDQLHTAELSATETRVALEKLGKGDASQFNKLFTNEELAANVTGLQDAIKWVKLYRDDAVFRFGEVGNALLPVNTQYKESVQRFKDLDAALASMPTDSASQSFSELSKQLYKSGLDAGTIVSLFPQMAEKARLLAEEANFDLEANGGVRALLGIMNGDLPPAMRKTLEATEAGRKALADMGVTAGSVTKSLEDLAKEQEDQRQAALTAAHSNIAYEQSLDDAAARVKEFSEEVRKGAAKRSDALNNDTEAGRKNRLALLGIAEAAKKNADDMRANKATTGEVAKENERAYQAFVRTAKGLGATSEQAARLAVEYGLIPKKVTTDIGAPGAKGTREEIDRLNKGLDDVDPVKRAEIIGIYKDQGMKAALAELAKSQSKTIHLYVKTHVDGQGNTVVGRIGNKTVMVAEGGLVAEAPVAYFAEGGSWSSPGNGSLSLTGGRVQGASLPDGKDNIPAMLRAKEYVHRESATDYYGMGVMHAMNQRRIPREVFAPWGFADGGSPTNFQPARDSAVSVTTQTVDLRALAAAAEAGVARGLDGVTFSLDGQPIDVRIERRMNKAARGLAGR